MTDPTDFDVRVAWGERGVLSLAPTCDALVIVDVLSFSTTVSIVVSAGATAVPTPLRHAEADALGRALGAEVAGPRGTRRYSLSPVSVRGIPPTTRLVLPSPNGSTLSALAAERIGPAGGVLAGSLRNRRAVARAAAGRGPRVGVIAAGERWPEDGSLRPALEDLVGAGAIVDALPGRRAPEAEAAVAAFRALSTGAADELERHLRACVSGQELVARGYASDVTAGAELDADPAAPILRDGAFVAAR